MCNDKPWLGSKDLREVPIALGKDLFFVDQTHFPATGHYEAKINPVGPLYTNLMRSGLRVADLEKWDADSLTKVRGTAFVAPRKPFTDQEISDLLRAEESGAVTLLAVGWEDVGPSLGLLRVHGLELAARPLGTTPPEAMAGRKSDQERPRFLDPWPIVTTDGAPLIDGPERSVVYRHGEDVLALFQRRGEGGLLLFADTRFFSSMNIEDMSGHWLGNLALIHDAFKSCLGTDPDAVRPLFRSPEKPR